MAEVIRFLDHADRIRAPYVERAVSATVIVLPVARIEPYPRSKAQLAQEKRARERMRRRFERA